MIPYREKKVENAIAYFAYEFNQRKGFFPRQTWIYKFLALLDFRILKRTGIPCLGLEYDAMKYGPVPSRLYDERCGLEKGKYLFVATKDSGWRVENSADPDLDYFSDEELDVMDEILAAYTRNHVDLENLVKDSHREIRAWGKAWLLALETGRGRMPMEYCDEFDDLLNKSANDLTPEEERFLRYRSMQIAEEEIKYAAESRRTG